MRAGRVVNGWHDLGGEFGGTCGIAAVSGSPGWLDLFAQGGDQQVWHRVWFQEHGWIGDWVRIGAPAPGIAPATRVAAVSPRPGRMDVVAIGSDWQCWWLAWDDDAGGWERLDFVPLGGHFEGASVIEAVAVSSELVNLVAVSGREAWRLELPARGFNPGTWTRLEGGPVAAGTELSATTSSPDRLDVVGVSPTGEALLWSVDAVAGTTAVRSIGGHFSGSRRVAVASDARGQLNFFGVAEDKQMWHRPWSESRGGRSGDWAPLGGEFTTGVVNAIAPRPGHLVVVGLDDAEGGHGCWAKSWRTESGWDPPGTRWAFLGGFFAADQVPALIRRGDRVDVLAVANSSWHRPGLDPLPVAIA